jgi:hypothetical protein
LINLVDELMRAEPDTWLETLTTKYKINAVLDGNLVSLKYDMIESPMAEPIVQQCRGMVVDCEARRVVAWPYNKFWNYGEGLAAKLDWSTAYAGEKLDGSLMILYWYDDAWRVASSGHPTAGGRLGAIEGRTFRDAFWEVWNASEMAFPPSRFQGTTFMFELCAHENRVVVKHDEPYIELHGARGEDGVELHTSQLDVMCLMRNWRRAETYALTTPEEVLEVAAKLNPVEQEGFVVVDANFNRIKVKSPRYVILHLMKDQATPRGAVRLWQTGEASELLTHFPELSVVITPIHEKLDGIAVQALEDFQKNTPFASRKDFALAIKDLSHATVLFRMLDLSEPTIDDVKTIMRRGTLASLERLAL